MKTINLSFEEVQVLREAITHELNDNSYCMGLASTGNTPQLKACLEKDKELLEGLEKKLGE